MKYPVENTSFFKVLAPNADSLLELKRELASEQSDPAKVRKSKAFTRLVDQISEMLAQGDRAILLKLEVKGECCFSIQELRWLSPSIGEELGELLVQNDQGDKVILVYDRDRLGSMNEGARYHQTREGGTIHTDNVNVPQVWRYLILSCLAPSEVGGESIIVDGIAVHLRLKEKFPQALRVLEQEFIWEMRGVADSLYRAPIITYARDGKPLFRHLRPYMESAHRKAGVPLTAEQLYAIDVLDALTNSLEFQVHFNLRQGDHLITMDSQVLHGRACFSDAIDAVTIDQHTRSPNQPLKRTMARIWVK